MDSCIIQEQSKVGTPWRAILVRPANLRPVLEERCAKLNEEAGYERYRVRPIEEKVNA